MEVIEMTFGEMVGFMQKKGYVLNDLIRTVQEQSLLKAGVEILLASTGTPTAVAKIVVTQVTPKAFRFSNLGMVTSAHKTREELITFMKKIDKKSLKNVQI